MYKVAASSVVAVPALIEVLALFGLILEVELLVVQQFSSSVVPWANLHLSK